MPEIKSYIGSVNAYSIALDTAVNEQPRTVPIVIDWAKYLLIGTLSSAAVRVNLVGQQVSTIDKIRSIMVDNSESEIPITITFPDTGFSITCPPGLTVSPVLTNALDFVVSADGLRAIFGQKTTINLLNTNRAGYFIPSNFQWGCVGRLLASPIISSAVPSTNLTVNFDGGDYDPSRQIVVVLKTNPPNSVEMLSARLSPASNINFFTSGTLLATSGPPSPIGSALQTWVWTETPPTNDLAITFVRPSSATTAPSGIAIYAVANAMTTTPLEIQTQPFSQFTNWSKFLQKGSFSIIAANNMVAPYYDFDVDVQAAGGYPTTAHIEAENDGPHSIVITLASTPQMFTWR